MEALTFEKATEIHTEYEQNREILAETPIALQLYQNLMFIKTYNIQDGLDMKVEVFPKTEDTPLTIEAWFIGADEDRVTEATIELQRVTLNRAQVIPVLVFPVHAEYPQESYKGATAFLFKNAC